MCFLFPQSKRSEESLDILENPPLPECTRIEIDLARSKPRVAIEMTSEPWQNWLARSGTRHRRFAPQVGLLALRLTTSDLQKQDANPSPGNGFSGKGRLGSGQGLQNV